MPRLVVHGQVGKVECSRYREEGVVPALELVAVAIGIDWLTAVGPFVDRTGDQPRWRQQAVIRLCDPFSRRMAGVTGGDVVLQVTLDGPAHEVLPHGQQQREEKG